MTMSSARLGGTNHNGVTFGLCDIVKNKRGDEGRIVELFTLRNAAKIWWNNDLVSFESLDDLQIIKHCTDVRAAMRDFRQRKAEPR